MFKGFQKKIQRSLSCYIRQTDIQHRPRRACCIYSSLSYYAILLRNEHIPLALFLTDRPIVYMYGGRLGITVLLDRTD
jgi:hypothetical protein